MNTAAKSDAGDATGSMGGEGSSGETTTPESPGVVPPSLWELFALFLMIGLTSFGGSVAAYVQKSVVVHKKWMTDKEFLAGYTLSVFLPGANTPNLAVYIGRHLRGGAGAIVAFIGVVFPPSVAVVIVGALLLTKSTPPHLAHALGAFGAAAVGLIAATAFNLGRKADLGTEGYVIVAAAIAMMGGFDLSIITTLIVLTPVSIALQHWRKSRA